MEPFQDKNELEVYQRKLGMEHAVANIDGKMLAFIDELLEVVVLRYDDQQLTLKLINSSQGMEILITLVFAKCSQGET